MNYIIDHLELQIIDCIPSGVGELRSGTYGNAGQGGRNLYITSGDGALLWYDVATGEYGFVDKNADGGVGLVLEDVDCDGIAEIFASDASAATEKGSEAIVMYKLNGQSWDKYPVCTTIPGHPHDIVFGDIDGDGIREIVTIACYTPNPGVYILKPQYFKGALPVTWSKHEVYSGVFSEGVSIGDLNLDGKMEIVSGPDWYSQPPDGPFSGHWDRHTYAPNYREMCRTKLADVTGNGRPDIFITDSEFMDGMFSWFENRPGPGEPLWVEHRLADRVEYSHSLELRQTDRGIDVFLAEMEQGGWKHPYNYNARLLLYSTKDHGASWTVRELYSGEGSHDAEIEITDAGVTVYGKTLGRWWLNPRIQVWKEQKVLNHLGFKHVMIDRDKPGPGTDILTFDPDGNGRKVIACGKWVYFPNDWTRIEVPDISQIINKYDIDGDGRDELIATGLQPAGADGKIPSFSNEICWLKMTASDGSQWERHPICTGAGDWPHGSLIAPVLPGGKPALLLSYHSANSGRNDFPQIVEIPDNPAAAGAWKPRNLTKIVYGEQLETADINGNGQLDIIAGAHWLRNNGDGSFTPFTITEDFAAARVAVADITGNGRSDVILVEEKVDYASSTASFARVAWFECPENPEDGPWPMHIIDSIRCPHSLSTGDIDGDGIPEFFIAEHDPFWPYRKRNRLFVYKSVDSGATWYRKTIDSRFEHHDGAKLAVIGDGRSVILSHGWKDDIYVHLWEIEVNGGT